MFTRPPDTPIHWSPMSSTGTPSHSGRQRDLPTGHSMTELSAEHARRAIVEHTRRLAESAAAAGPDAVVPTTPEWTITELVEHVGQTQHWVAEIIERRITDPAQLPAEFAVLPTDPREWQAWLSESAQRIASACSDDALDAPVFNPAQRRAVGDAVLDLQRPQRVGRPRLRRRQRGGPTGRHRHRHRSRAHQQPPGNAHLACVGDAATPSPPTPFGAPGRPCSGWPPIPRTTQALGSSNGGLKGRRGSPEPSGPM